MAFSWFATPGLEARSCSGTLLTGRVVPDWIPHRAAALDALRTAVERGFAWEGMVDDEDLLSLHGDPRFEALLAQALEN